MRLEITLHIGAEGADIGQAAAVRADLIGLKDRVPVRQFTGLALDIASDGLHLLQSKQLVIRKIADGILVNVK
ncbi:hypothetical protein [Gemmobacter sp. 24YEA27]|uniref:hypothetical protein n=1 Tax=Gemmobacter sp. 24YEA27 TaxID=3040672 RepID=UPI0024B35118|nr:hypothetical protein [Gemmobacter sp. 24YEA27]